MKKSIFTVALLLAGLFVCTSAAEAQARGRVYYNYGPRVGVRFYVAPPVYFAPPVYVAPPVVDYGYNYGYSEPVVVAPPSYVYYGQVSVPVIWYPDFGVYGYYNGGAFFGWH